MEESTFKEIFPLAWSANVVSEGEDLESGQTVFVNKVTTEVAGQALIQLFDPALTRWTV